MLLKLIKLDMLHSSYLVMEMISHVQVTHARCSSTPPHGVQTVPGFNPGVSATSSLKSPYMKEVNKEIDANTWQRFSTTEDTQSLGIDVGFWSSPNSPFSCVSGS